MVIFCRLRCKEPMGSDEAPEPVQDDTDQSRKRTNDIDVWDHSLYNTKEFYEQVFNIILYEKYRRMINILPLME